MCLDTKYYIWQSRISYTGDLGIVREVLHGKYLTCAQVSLGQACMRTEVIWQKTMPALHRHGFKHVVHVQSLGGGQGRCP